MWKKKRKEIEKEKLIWKKKYGRKGGLIKNMEKLKKKNEKKDE